MDRQARLDHWQDIYATKPEAGLSWFESRPDFSLQLIARADVPRDAPILDVGGGTSRLVDCLLEKGYGDVSVLDISQSALDIARARLGPRAKEVTWLCADITRWTPPRTFRLWHDRAVFHFLTGEDERRVYAATLAQALEKGGQAIIGTFAEDGPERCSGLPVRRHSAQDLAGFFAAHFTCLESPRHEHATPASTQQKFQFCRLLRT